MLIETPPSTIAVISKFFPPRAAVLSAWEHVDASGSRLRLVSCAYVPSPLLRQVRWSLFARFSPFVGGLPREKVRSAPAIVFTGPGQRSLTLWPARSRSRLATPALTVSKANAQDVSTPVYMNLNWSAGDSGFNEGGLCGFQALQSGTHGRPYDLTRRRRSIDRRESRESLEYLPAAFRSYSVLGQRRIGRASAGGHLPIGGIAT